MAPDVSCQAEAEILARTLRLPLATGDQAQGFSLALALLPERIELRSLGPGAPGPVYSDLCDEDVRRRIQGGKRQPLGRACGLHRGDSSPRLLDATAGLGRDGVVLAGLGCQVTLLERSPVVAALLRDGLRRALADPVLGLRLNARLEFQQTDAISFMQSQQANPHDIVYLDPMFPHRRKTALVKKEMRVLRAITGDDPDAGSLLQAALSYARRRVVVKRAPSSGSIAGCEPDHQLQGNRACYDVYFTSKNKG